MNTTPELDELKRALQGLEQRLARSHALECREHHRVATARIQWGLWPLWLGQIAQILFGLLCIGLGAAVWSALRDGSAVFFSAIVVHVYGVACIMLAGVVLGQLARIDRSEALLDTQTRLARLRRLHIVAGMAVGLSWWLLWIPFVATLLYWLARADLYANLGGFTVAMMVAGGMAGLLGTYGLHRWARNPARPELARAMDAAITGRSLTRAQHRLDELKAFADGGT